MKYVLIGILAIVALIIFVVQVVVCLIEILPTILIGFVILGAIMLIYYLIMAFKKRELNRYAEKFSKER